MKESYHTHGTLVRAMCSGGHPWLKRKRHVTHTNESCHIHKWVMPHIKWSHATHTNGSCHTCKWVTSHMKEPQHICATLIRAMFWRASLTPPESISRAACMPVCVTWRIHVCDMNLSYVCQDSSIPHKASINFARRLHAYLCTSKKINKYTNLWVFFHYMYIWYKQCRVTYIQSNIYKI